MQQQKLTFATFREMTRLELSLFGLPYVVCGALLPFASFLFFANYKSIDALRLLWLVPAFLAARTAGMAFNQLIDSRIDAKNSRTAKRVIPSGRLSEDQVGKVAWISLFCFLVICSFAGKICLGLGVLAACLIVLYSYMKRIHMSCHFVLGAIHTLAPVMAAALVSKEFYMPALYLGLVAGLSIAANDIIYAIQDLKFDVEESLHSIPAKLGVNKALWIARICHTLVLFAYMKMAKAALFPRSSVLCVFILAYIYLQFHRKLLKALKEKSQIAELFKSCNLMVPLVVLFFVFLGVLWSSA